MIVIKIVQSASDLYEWLTLTLKVCCKRNKPKSKKLCEAVFKYSGTMLISAC